MANLYLNFAENMETGSSNWNDYYTASLQEQYEKLKKKLGRYAPDNLQIFLQSVFPTGLARNYYLSMPGFERKIEKDHRKRDCLYNIVLRPENDRVIDGVTFSKFDLIFIGDLVFGSVVEVTVKGIELIDKKIVKFGEKKINCTALCALKKKTFQNREGKTVTVPDYGTREVTDPVLTHDFVNQLCGELYPIPHPEQAIKMLEDWREYVQFRRYYLKKQSEHCEETDEVAVCNSFMMTRAEYRRNEERYASLILDGVEQFSKSEQVILREKQGNAEAFPLVRVTIDRNKKQLYQDTIGKSGKGKPKFEAHLQRYTQEAMGLSFAKPQFDDKNNQRGVKSYGLGERYWFDIRDIAPDLTGLEQKFEKDKKQAEAEIDGKYDSIIRNELKKYMDRQHAAVEEKYQREFETFEAEQLRIVEDPESGKKKVQSAQKKIDDKRKSLNIQKQKELDKLSKDRQGQLELQYRDQRNAEKRAKEEALREKFREAREEKIENETIRRYMIYFRPNGNMDRAADIEKEIEKCGSKYLIYDNRAEKAKIDRQERALDSLARGYVRNPYLPTYLFAPELLAQSDKGAEKEPDWLLSSLNSGQKTAVRRALASESIFLLQGPPGTGKTQVIAELTAQFAKQGKKVLISSETHKAIDNVFERLPKIPEIRPLRLIPSQAGKENNFSPEKLVDNFYENIRSNLERQVDRFEHFEETKDSFDEEMKKLSAEYRRLLRLKRENAKTEAERERLLSEISRGNIRLQQLREDRTAVREIAETCLRTQKRIEACSFEKEDADALLLERFEGDVVDSLMQFFCLAEYADLYKIREIYFADLKTVREEVEHLLPEDEIGKLQAKQIQLRKELSALRDPDTDEAPAPGDDRYEEYKEKQAELIALSKAIKQYDGEKVETEGFLYDVAPSIVGHRELLLAFPSEVEAFQKKTREIIAMYVENLETDIEKARKEEGEISSKIDDLQAELAEKKNMYERKGENEEFLEYGELSSALKQKINRFFHDFGIIAEYDPDDFAEAFSIIEKEWDKLETGYAKTKNENELKIPMYRDISKYLSQEDILEEDRRSFTRVLYDNVNVFGITCTSRDRFTPAQLTELGNYGIKTVDIRSQDIDVVIVDEVSKSAFLDLLIPILYGKTVVLVGDHRQLPPMYDLRHMRKEDFEGLDEEIISKKINDIFTQLYEECYFKTLYERVPDDFRVMLNMQYRCHSHIMEVFNHFYGGDKNGLQIGKKQQDAEKEHGLTVKMNGETLIEPRYHVYFVDCTEKESSAFEGSTSKVNEQEAEVTLRLLRSLNEASEQLVKDGKCRIDKNRRIDERPSVGVICTYGDQARRIQRKRKGQRFDGFSEKQDEKLVISTVDDFQGDERDVIILSMVRNPVSDRYNAEFIKKFERINVALSRARKLLIVVGSRNFLTTAGIIDLPDLSGKHSRDRLNYPVYREIIDTINFRGKILTANQILGE